MRKIRIFAQTGLLALIALAVTGCAAEYYDYSTDYDYVDYGEPDIIICPGPPIYPDPYPDPIVVTGNTPPPRHQPLPKPVTQPPSRVKEPEREPRTPAPRAPKPPRGGAGTRSTKNGQVRR